MQGYLTNNFLMTLSGLAANSSYSLYVYTQGDNNSAGRGVTLSATGAGSATSLQTNAGSYILGNNYLLFQGATNAHGQLTVTETSYNGEADINGFQLTTTTAVPEPATWAMMLLGFVGLGFAGTRREKLNRVDLAAAI